MKELGADMSLYIYVRGLVGRQRESA